MDHISEGMLSGMALALVVIAGLVMVALDDIIAALLRLRRSKESAPDTPIGNSAPQQRRRGALARQPEISRSRRPAH